MTFIEFAYIVRKLEFHSRGKKFKDNLHVYPSISVYIISLAR